jgi:hypothetical protein
MFVSLLVLQQIKYRQIKLINNIFLNSRTEAGATFDNSFFDNYLDLVRQCKDRSFLGTFTVHKKVEIRINRT